MLIILISNARRPLGIGPRLNYPLLLIDTKTDTKHRFFYAKI